MEGIGSARIPLIGRTAELDVLRETIDDAAQGHGRTALLEGEAGIGKTRLLTEALEIARGRGFEVLFGECDELERDRPLSALSEVLGIGRGTTDPGRADLARLLSARATTATSVTPGAGAGDEGWLIVEALLDVLEDLASTVPVVLAVDDLQWADPLTLRALQSVHRYLTRVPMLLLVTARRGARGVDINRVLANLVARGAEHVVLTPLPAQESADLAGRVVGLPVGPQLVEQVGGAGGNPLFVIELVRALADDGALELHDGCADAFRVSPPPTLRLTILRRLSLLPEDALSLLRIASILGSTFSVAELALLTGKNTTTMMPELHAVVDTGLLTEAGERLAFRHDLVRDAIYHDLPLPVRMALHRDAAAALAGAAAPIERVASHVVLGAEAGDTGAVDWLQRAAQTAARRAPATAVRLLEHALDISGTDDRTRDALEAELVTPLFATGRVRDAEVMARGVLARGPEPAVDVIVRTGLAAVLSSTAQYPEAIRHLEQAALAATERERPSLEASGSLLMVLAGELGQAREAATRAVDVGERLGNDHAVCQGLQALAMAALAEGLVDEAISLAQRAVAVVQRNDATWVGYVVPQLWYGTALSDADRFSEAEAAFHAGRRQAEQSGNLSRLSLYHWAIAETRLGAGQWDDAVAEAEAGLGLIEEADNQVGDVFAHAMRAHVAYHRGDHPRARAAVDEARRRLVAGPVEIGYEWMSWIDALLLEAQGQPAQALRTLAAAWDDSAPVRYIQASTRAMGADLVRIAVAFGEHERALAVTEELERTASRNPCPTARGLALRCRGALENDADILLQAVTVLREGPRPYPLAAACEDAGLALGRIANANASVPLLVEALAEYERLEAAWDVARVRAALAGLGATRRRRSRHRPTFGWESLTPTERQVVSLAVEGLTNRKIAERLFVSRRTVSTHMEHIFQKLGHANRVELAADAARRELSR